MLGGDRLALARLITHVENRTPAVPGIMKAVHARRGRGCVVGTPARREPASPPSSIGSPRTCAPRARRSAS
ncbi:MAG TPA: hypothetical protein VFW70_17955 [Methylomirabilota bacterium]|nr:hypothetical protein [Methylomirabilota bacterium]